LGSSAIKDAEGTTVWERFKEFSDSKNFNQRDLISAEFNY